MCLVLSYLHLCAINLLCIQSLCVFISYLCVINPYKMHCLWIKKSVSKRVTIGSLLYLDNNSTFGSWIGSKSNFSSDLLWNFSPKWWAWKQLSPSHQEFNPDKKWSLRSKRRHQANQNISLNEDVILSTVWPTTANGDNSRDRHNANTSSNLIMVTQSKSKTIITRSMLTISLIVFTDKLQGYLHTFYSKWYFITF